MHEGVSAEETPVWDPNSGIPPPMTAEYGYVEQLTPPPLPEWGEAPQQQFDMSQVPPLPRATGQAPFDYSQVPPLPVEAQPFDMSQVPPLPMEQTLPIPQDSFDQSPTVFAEDIPDFPSNEEIPATKTIKVNEKEEELPPLGILDRELMNVGISGPEKMAEFLGAQRELSDNTPIELYHGLNGGLGKALAVLESPDEGVRQISGPCLAVYPVGQFWKPGDAGLRYSIPRGLIEYPGESRPDAKFRIDERGVVSMVGGLESLPLSKYNGEVIRTERKKDIVGEKVVDGFIEEEIIGEEVVPLTEEEVENQKKIAKRMAELGEIRTLSESIKAVAENSPS